MGWGLHSHYIVKPNLVLRLGWGFDNNYELVKLQTQQYFPIFYKVKWLPWPHNTDTVKEDKVERKHSSRGIVDNIQANVSHLGLELD